MGMKPDYRTWWRKGNDVHRALFCINHDWQVDDDESDCIVEQLWAIREGLAE